MITTMAALIMSGGSVLPPANVAASDLPQLFEAACLNGEAKLSPGTASAINFDALPQELRQSLGKPSSAQVWRLSSQGNAFLYILAYEPSHDANPKICGLASDEMNYGEAADAVEMRVTGSVSPRTMKSTQWLNLQSGYDALATTAGSFKVLQINWLSDAQRSDLLRIKPTIP